MKKDYFKKKLFYTGIAAALLFTGLPSSKTFAANPTTQIKKNIEELKSVKNANNHNAKFSNLSINYLLNKASKTGFKSLGANDGYIFESEPNDLFSMANPLELGIGIAGDFSYNGFRDGDFDSFQINITKPGNLWLGGILNRVDYYTDFGFGLFDSTGNIVKPVDYGVGDTGIRYQVLPVQPGTYYIAATNLANLVSYDYYMLLANMVDGTAPDAPIVDSIDDNDKNISGVTESDSTVVIKKGTTIYTTVKADDYGYFNIKLPKPFKAGTKLTFFTQDSAGNVSKSTTITVSDKTAPALKVNKVTKSSTYVTGKTEAKTYVKVKVGSKTLASGKSSSKGDFKLKIKSQKKNTVLTISAKDSAGNTKIVKVKVK